MGLKDLLFLKHELREALANVLQIPLSDVQSPSLQNTENGDSVEVVYTFIAHDDTKRSRLNSATFGDKLYAALLEIPAIYAVLGKNIFLHKIFKQYVFSCLKPHSVVYLTYDDAEDRFGHQYLGFRAGLALRVAKGSGNARLFKRKKQERVVLVF